MASSYLVVFLHSHNRLNLTKTVRKFSIDSNLRPTGHEFQPGPATNVIKHDEKVDEESLE
ncbi:protein disulfide-isomerase 5-4-like, partial [Trifolium medium]|nr:protein disulfide-isomerase 5-4-like [Trifolium medium]